MRHGLVAAGVGFAALAGSPPAQAGYPDLFGWGPEAVAHAGAGVASATDFAATWLNPAGLAFAPGGSLHAGGAYVGSLLSVGDARREIPDPWGLPVGLVVRGRGDDWLARHVAAGIGAYVLPDAIIRITTHAPADPQFPYYENRTQRLVVLPALALRLHESLAVGVAANYFAALAGPAAARDGPVRATETAITEVISSRATLIAGVRFAPAPGWAFGLTWRQRFLVPYTVDTRNLVGGIPLDINVAAEGLFTPDELVLGARWTPGRVALVADVAWNRWSAWRGPWVQVQASLPGLDLRPALPDPGFRDTVAVRLGGSWRLPYAGERAVEVRGGAGFEPAIVGDQPGRTNLFDGDRWIVAAGASLDLPPAWGVTARLGVATQLHVVGARSYAKQVGTPAQAARDPNVLADEDASRPGVQTTNPGYPSITGGGQVWTFTWGLEVDL